MFKSRTSSFNVEIMLIKIFTCFKVSNKNEINRCIYISWCFSFQHHLTFSLRKYTIFWTNLNQMKVSNIDTKHCLSSNFISQQKVESCQKIFVFCYCLNLLNDLHVVCNRLKFHEMLLTRYIENVTKKKMSFFACEMWRFCKNVNLITITYLTIC